MLSGSRRHDRRHGRADLCGLTGYSAVTRPARERRVAHAQSDTT